MTINTSRSNSPETQHPAASSRSKCWTSRHERIRNLADLTLRWFGLRRQVWRKELKQTRECRASRNKPCELLIGRCRPSWKWLGVSAMNERWHKALYCSLLQRCYWGKDPGGPLPYLPTHRSTSTANLQPSKQPKSHSASPTLMVFHGIAVLYCAPCNVPRMSINQLCNSTSR